MRWPPETVIKAASAASTARMKTGIARSLFFPRPRYRRTIMRPGATGNAHDTSYPHPVTAVLLLATVIASALGAACGGAKGSDHVVGVIEACQVQSIRTDGRYFQPMTGGGCTAGSVAGFHYELTIKTAKGTTYTVQADSAPKLGSAWPPEATATP